MTSILYGLHDFLSCLNEFHPNLKFTYEYSTEKINVLDVIVKKLKDEFVTHYIVKQLTVTNTSTMTIVIQIL